ncbi:MAG: ABC transporter ATP-binding protein [Bacillota bacterium]|nr:ABC transporter ATP-binding protein [Bacillota bacterium]
MNMISVSRLTKTYGDLTAVDDISFQVEKGEIYGFLGPNGAGKTSTINMMIGLSRPSAGEIEVAGIDVRRRTKKAQAGMGIVPDESNLYNEMDGFDNLCFCASLYGMRREEREAKARRLLTLFRLDDAGRRPFKAYSRGMRRRLTIAAALIHSPQVLFLDEPTTGIDVESSRQIRDLIVELKQQGTTIFLTTHYIEEAERICDRIAFIAGGRIVAAGSLPELMDSVSRQHAIRFITAGNSTVHAAELESRFAGSEVRAQADRTIVMTSRQRIPLFPVMEFLHNRGVEVLEARELRPSLEDVFVRLTGIDTSVPAKPGQKEADQ